jgi:hypothetical protein
VLVVVEDHVELLRITDSVSERPFILFDFVEFASVVCLRPSASLYRFVQVAFSWKWRLADPSMLAGGTVMSRRIHGSVMLYSCKLPIVANCCW